jgi:hypothetical protein
VALDGALPDRCSDAGRLDDADGLVVHYTLDALHLGVPCVVDVSRLELDFDDLSALYMLLVGVDWGMGMTYCVVDMRADDEAFSATEGAVLESDDVSGLDFT